MASNYENMLTSKIQKVSTKATIVYFKKLKKYVYKKSLPSINNLHKPKQKPKIKINILTKQSSKTLTIWNEWRRKDKSTIKNSNKKN